MNLCWWCNRPCEHCNEYQQLCDDCQAHIDSTVEEYDAIERKWAMEQNESLQQIAEHEDSQ